MTYINYSDSVCPNCGRVHQKLYIMWAERFLEELLEKSDFPWYGMHDIYKRDYAYKNDWIKLLIDEVE